MAVLAVDGFLYQQRMLAAFVNMICTCFRIYSATSQVTAVVAAELGVYVQHALRSTLGNAMRGTRAAVSRAEKALLVNFSLRTLQPFEYRYMICHNSRAGRQLLITFRKKSINPWTIASVRSRRHRYHHLLCDNICCLTRRGWASWHFLRLH